MRHRFIHCSAFGALTGRFLWIKIHTPFCWPTLEHLLSEPTQTEQLLYTYRREGMEVVSAAAKHARSRACLACQKRKGKCDGNDPCSYLFYYSHPLRFKKTWYFPPLYPHQKSITFSKSFNIYTKCFLFSLRIFNRATLRLSFEMITFFLFKKNNGNAKCNTKKCYFDSMEILLQGKD